MRSTPLCRRTVSPRDDAVAVGVHRTTAGRVATLASLAIFLDRFQGPSVANAAGSTATRRTAITREAAPTTLTGLTSATAVICSAVTRAITTTSLRNPASASLPATPRSGVSSDEGLCVGVIVVWDRHLTESTGTAPLPRPACRGALNRQPILLGHEEQQRRYADLRYPFPE